MAFPPPNSRQKTTTRSGREIEILSFGIVDYLACQEMMRVFTQTRTESAMDQIWLLQHPQVYTQGTACDQQPLAPSNIPLLQSDRGGQITFHGPGQIVVYPLLNLKRFGIGVKSLVSALEQSVIDVLQNYKIKGLRREGAPGIYVQDEKIAALGLRIRRGASYHGLSLNVDMELAPFGNIDPCGFAGLQATQMADHCASAELDLAVIGSQLLENFCAQI